MYSRETELRHIKANDIYKLGVILDENNCWKKLMEIIPKELNAQASSANGALDWDQATTSMGFKYNNDHIRLVEAAIKRPGESRLLSEILFDEWGTSGRKCQRPTVGVLLQLLVKAELFRAADFVAKHFLNESSPERPLNGPAARIDISLTSDIFDDIKDQLNDSSFYPGTEALNDNAHYGNSLADYNKDFYTKYQRMDKIVEVANDKSEPVPVPPPRMQRSARLLQQQRHFNEASTAEAVNNTQQFQQSDQQQIQSEHSHLPKFSQLMTNKRIAAVNTNSDNTTSHSSAPHTESTNLSDAPIPMISVLGGPREATSETTTRELESTVSNSDILPVISALNLHGERDECIMVGNLLIATDSHQTTVSSNSVTSDNSDDDDENELPYVLPNIAENEDGIEQLNDDNCDVDDNDYDDDEDCSSMPNLSVFGQRSSNNDSSLTNVTGTSGENSFELSMNDCSSASNENIPCLSALKP